LTHYFKIRLEEKFEAEELIWDEGRGRELGARLCESEKEGFTGLRFHDIYIKMIYTR
jgi:hypothetical protein